jgi:predicted deacylase
VPTAIAIAAIALLVTEQKSPEPKAEQVVQEPAKEVPFSVTTIGTSIEGRNIESYQLGQGSTRLLFVGGIHGGYEWNSTLLAYQVIEYLQNNKQLIPSGVVVDIIPSLNPDGLYKVTKKNGIFTKNDVTTDKETLRAARFNARSVDLNRNFDCMWQPKSTWQSKTVSAGVSPFSEPEAKAFKQHIEAHPPISVVFWHSKANGVFGSKCHDPILQNTKSILEIYSSASGYPATQTFDAYAVTGAAEDWLASIRIPAITVELSSHEDTDFEKNIPAVSKLIKLLSEQ